MNVQKWQTLSNEEVLKVLREVYRDRSGALAFRTDGPFAWSADNVASRAEGRGHAIRTLFQSATLEWERDLTAGNTASLVRTHVLRNADPVLVADNAPPGDPQGFIVQSSDFDPFLAWHLEEYGRPMFLSPDLLALNLTTFTCLLGHHSGLILLMQRGDVPSEQQ